MFVLAVYLVLVTLVAAIAMDAGNNFLGGSIGFNVEHNSDLSTSVSMGPVSILFYFTKI